MTLKLPFVQQVAITVGGPTQEFEADLDGETPQAAFFMVTKAITPLVAADHAALCFGATDGTNQWAANMQAEHGVPTTDADRRMATDECIQIMALNGFVDGEAAFSSFSANKITINWGNLPNGAYLVTVLLASGSHLSALAGTFNPSGVDGVSVVVPVPFEANVLICAGIDAPADDTRRDSAILSLGFITNRETGDANIQQMHYGNFFETHNVGSGQAKGGVKNNQGFGAVATGDWIYTLEFHTFNAAGFSVQTNVISGPDATDAIGFLALNTTIAVHDVAVTLLETPTSIGNLTHTGTGHKPQFLMLGMSYNSVINVWSETEWGSVGVGMATEDDEFSVSVSNEDGAPTTNTQNLVSANQTANLPLSSGAAGIEADLVSFIDDGVILNFPVVDGTARNWFLLTIEEEPTPPEPEDANLPEYGQVRTAIGDPPVFGATIFRS